MHFKNILLSFWISLTVAVSLRVLQMFFSIDSVTGFYKPAYKSIGMIITLIIFAIAFLQTVVSLSVRRAPVKMPKLNKKIGIAALALSASIVFDIISLKAPVPAWQKIFVVLFGVATAVYFVLLALNSFKPFALPSILSVLPVLYFCVKLIYFFTATSSIALISSNLLIIAAQIFVLLFMFEFSKLCNDIDSDNSYKRISITGFVSSLLCAVASIPSFLSVILTKSPSQTSILSSSVCIFFSGIFIYLFVRRYFSGKNLKHHKRYREHHRCSTEKFTNNFYVGD